MSSTYIIAEIGNNHNSSVEKALELINSSAKAGVDAVKFQSFTGIDIVSPKVLTSEYKGWESVDYKYWYQFAESVALPLDRHQEVIDYTHKCGLDFITTPVSPSIVDYLETLSGIDKYKIASMDLNNFGLLKAVSRTQKPVIISTGMADLSEVSKAIELLGKREISILHCVSDYPLNPENANLNNLKILMDKFPSHNIGFSDHSLGYELSLATVAMGAKLIEKHVTMDRNDKSPAEHHFSMEPDELKEMVKWLRIIDKNLSQSEWSRSPDEGLGRQMYRRSFHYKYKFLAGHKIQEDDMVFVRPGYGVNYNDIENIIGHELNQDVDEFEPCMLDHIVK
jgi:N,N'-diacetyllegionaminate synthase